MRKIKKKRDRDFCGVATEMWSGNEISEDSKNVRKQRFMCALHGAKIVVVGRKLFFSRIPVNCNPLSIIMSAIRRAEIVIFFFYFEGEWLFAI